MPYCDVRPIFVANGPNSKTCVIRPAASRSHLSDAARRRRAAAWLAQASTAARRILRFRCTGIAARAVAATPSTGLDADRDRDVASGSCRRPARCRRAGELAPRDQHAAAGRGSRSSYIDSTDSGAGRFCPDGGCGGAVARPRRLRKLILAALDYPRRLRGSTAAASPARNSVLTELGASAAPASA